MGKKQSSSASVSPPARSTEISSKKKCCKSFKWFFGLILAVVLIQTVLIELRAAGATKTKEEWQVLIKDHPYERKASDARGPCPMLNLLANHGFLPRDGRHITKQQLFDALMLIGAPPTITYNFLNFAYFIYHNVKPTDPFYQNFLPAKTISLDQLLIHNVIEHDVSLTRFDLDQAPHDLVHPHPDLVQRIHDWVLLQQHTNDDNQVLMTLQDEHDLRKIRWHESTATNPKIHLPITFQFTSSTECALLMDIIGQDGILRADHIESLLLHEKFPDDWYPREKAYPALKALTRPIQCWYGMRKSSADLKSLDLLKKE